MNLRFILVALTLGCLTASAGCELLPQPVSQPSVHNPFPQLSRVAVAPFFNASGEPTLDGQSVAIAYFNELQAVPGFEVVPVMMVEHAIRATKNPLACPADAQRLARFLEVDAVVIGTVTDFSPYYPPRCGLQVNWYAANPGYHPIPPGYGLPWGTHEEQEIPEALAFEAEFALAKEQMKTQTPPVPPGMAEEQKGAAETTRSATDENGNTTPKKLEVKQQAGDDVTKSPGVAKKTPNGGKGPVFWPDPRGFVPPPPSGQTPACWPSEAPVLSHTRVYHGNDASFTAALENYYVSRDEARFDGWQGYLQRSDDFVRFCCHMHIWEMLTARGGAGQTRVVWRWSTIR